MVILFRAFRPEKFNLFWVCTLSLLLHQMYLPRQGLAYVDDAVTILSRLGFGEVTKFVASQCNQWPWQVHSEERRAYSLLRILYVYPGTGRQEK